MEKKNPFEKTISQVRERDVEILQMLADGMTARRIGSKVFLSPKTVAARIARLKDITGSNTTTQCVIEALRFGLIK